MLQEKKKKKTTKEVRVDWVLFFTVWSYFTFFHFPRRFNGSVVKKNLDKPRSHFLKSQFVLKVDNMFGTKLLLFTYSINSCLELNHRRRSLTLFCFLLVGETIGTSKAKGWPVKQSLVSVGSEVRWEQRNLSLCGRHWAFHYDDEIGEAYISIINNSSFWVGFFSPGLQDIRCSLLYFPNFGEKKRILNLFSPCFFSPFFSPFTFHLT